MMKLRTWFGAGRSGYARRAPLVLLNGLAEQPESWYANLHYWRRHFDVYMPNLLCYDGAGLQRRVEDGLPVDIDYLVEQLYVFLDQFVQTPPFHLVASSLGGKVAVEFAVRYPEYVSRMVLLCPSGLSDEERLPIIEGVRRNDTRALIDSVFHDPSCADPNLLPYYKERLANRRWRTGFLRAVRGTTEHRVVDRLPLVQHPTMLIVGQEDRICDPQQSIDAAPLLPNGKLVVLPQCGHAPQIEKADEVNALVVQFLTQPEPARVAVHAH
jgi:pimeloyl-ACP methyl ester carboxylesterase